jgi:hypothetical protein
MHVDIAIGWVAGHMPQAHMAPLIPPAQLHVVCPYMQGGSCPHAMPPF